MTPDDLIGKPDVLILATREPDVAYRISRPPGPVRYDLAVDYGQPPIPPLADDDAGWAALLVAQHTTAG